MHGDDLPNILSVVSIVLTLIVMMYARGTIMEVRRTTAEERSAVIQLTAIGAAQQATVGELQTLGQGTKDLQEQASKAAMASLAQAKAAWVEADLARQASPSRSRPWHPVVPPHQHHQARPRGKGQLDEKPRRTSR
jgi:hypothetical protein